MTEPILVNLNELKCESNSNKNQIHSTNPKSKKYNKKIKN